MILVLKPLGAFSQKEQQIGCADRSVLYFAVYRTFAVTVTVCTNK